MDWTPSKNLPLFFNILHLTCCKFVALKENTPTNFFKIITVSRPNTILQVFLGTKSLKYKTAEQDYLPNLYPLYPLSDKKIPLPLMLLCCPHQVWTVPPPPESLWETLGMGEEFHPTAKNLLISPTRKIFFNKIMSSPIRNLIPFASNNDFHVITLKISL